MATEKTKFLDYAGLEYILGQLKARKVFGNLGLSEQSFTSAMKEKLDALRDATESEKDLTELTGKVNELTALIESDKDGAINKFNEIVAFLAGVSDTKTLDGMIAEIGTQIAAAKKSGDDAAAALGTYKTSNDAAVAAAKKAGDDAAAALDTYKTSNNTAVSGLQSKVEAAEGAITALQSGKQDAMTAITNAEIDTLIAAE